MLRGPTSKRCWRGWAVWTARHKGQLACLPARPHAADTRQPGRNTESVLRKRWLLCTLLLHPWPAAPAVHASSAGQRRGGDGGGRGQPEPRGGGAAAGGGCSGGSATGNCSKSLNTCQKPLVQQMENTGSILHVLVPRRGALSAGIGFCYLSQYKTGSVVKCTLLKSSQHQSL